MQFTGQRIGDPVAEFQAIQDRLADDLRGGVSRATARLQADLRGRTIAAGLGSGLANAWRARVFPQGGRSLHPAGSVISAAPLIVSAFANGATIRPVNGSRYLWIPTDNVPRAGIGLRQLRDGREIRSRSARMSPSEVEDAFNQDFRFATSTQGRLVAYIEAVQGQSGRIRRPTRGRLARGRQVQRIVMFILVPVVRLAPRLDLNAARQLAQSYLAGEVAAAVAGAI